MSSHFLAIDFGTTSTKSALIDLECGTFVGVDRRTPQSAPAPTKTQTVTAAHDVSGRHELSLDELLRRFDAICHAAWQTHEFDGIVLCSEMHGFVLVGPDGTPQTNYVSWLDARSLERIDGDSTHDLVIERLGDLFRSLTGMRPRPGFPLLNIAHTCRTGEVSVEEAWALSLPLALARLSHDGFAGADLVEHPTMLAAMAMADVESGSIPSDPLLECIRVIGGCQIQLGTPCTEATISGHWPGPQGLVPIYAGVGDHQCSVLGAGPFPILDANLNLGTGSQVSIIDGPVSQAFERRPYFEGRMLTAVTHIPAGRALNEFIGFLEDIAHFAGTTGDFWQALGSVTPQQISQAHLQMDLSVFEGARGWRNGGSIAGITEGSLTVQSYLAGVLGAFVQQYVDVLAELDPQTQLRRLILSGGIARQLPQLQQILAELTSYSTTPAADLDESLLGLRALALRAAGRADTVADAWDLFGRQCHQDPPAES
ncbi:MAG: hypothetical protein CME24_09025 [Gemmatimonadetes bacterium]|nr:hypothetical protein [Gemmatimonadota bacterium]